MNNSEMQILLGVTIFLIGLYFVFARVLDFLELNGDLTISIGNSLSVLIAIFATLTAALMIKDAIKSE